MISFFVDSIYIHKINIVEAEGDHGNVLNNIIEFHNKFRPSRKQDKDKKNTYENACTLCEGR